MSVETEIETTEETPYEAAVAMEAEMLGDEAVDEDIEMQEAVEELALETEEPVDEDTDAEDTTEDSEPEPEKETVSNQFDELLAKEKELRARESDVSEKESAHLAHDDLSALAKSDPLAFLEKFGITYDDLTDSIIDNHSQDPHMKQLEDRLAKFEKADTDRQVGAEQAAMQVQVDKYIGELNTHIEDSEYEIIKAVGANQMVIDTITAYYKENGTELEVDEACKQVESWLIDNELPKMQKLMETQKVKSMLDKETVEAPKTRKTLSNKTATKAPRRKTGPETGEDVVDRAYRMEAELKRNS